jgi:hypothetical protein
MNNLTPSCHKSPNTNTLPGPSREFTWSQTVFSQQLCLFDAKAEIEMGCLASTLTVRRIVRVAVRRPAIRCVVVPTATTVHAVRALKDRSPPMVVTQNCETASFSRQQLARKPLMQ